MEVNKSHFPIRILIVKTDEIRIIKTAESVPQGELFRVLEINCNE